MRFIGLKKQFKNADIIDVQNIFNYYSHIDRRRLYEWQKKDYIKKIVNNIISISTRKTRKIETDLAYFQYNSINKKLFWGYGLKNTHNRYFFISDPEKTLLDYLYFKPHLSGEDDFIELRLNEEELKKRINVQRLEDYLELFSHRRLNTSIHILMEMLHVKF